MPGRETAREAEARCPSRMAMVKPMVEQKRGRPGRPKGPGPVRGTVVALKGTTDWKAWLDEFAAHCRLGLADTIEQSLVAYARARGYRAPPKR